MKVRALTKYVDEAGVHQRGDEYVMADHLAVIRIKSGLVQRVADELERAVTLEAETAVTRKRRV